MLNQIINFLCESYPLEAISYCLQRCFYNTFSKTSLLDKIIKYLLTKYKEIYVPTIYLLDYSDTTKSPFNILAANSTQSPAQYNQLTGQAINNNQNNSILNNISSSEYSLPL